jgi:uncharacterized membrane protein
MGKGRLEAFSDGVFAIIITIMVLEIKVPHGEDWAALRPLAPVLAAYLLSFVYVGIYWNNHHHLLHACKRVSAAVLWANLHLLFWLSLIPVTTAWADEAHFHSAPVVAYGVVLMMAGVAYWVLQRAIVATDGDGSTLRRAIGEDWKGRGSVLLLGLAVFVGFYVPQLSLAIYVLIALLWFVPDRRIERALAQGERG